MSRRRPGSRFHAAIKGKRWERVRRAVFDRDGWRCVDCGSAVGLECDHIESLQSKPEQDPFDMANLQTLCSECHAAKTRSENRREPTPAEAEWRDLVAELMRPA